MRRTILALLCLASLVAFSVDAVADGTATMPLDRFEQLVAAARPVQHQEAGAAYGVVGHVVTVVEDGPELRVRIRLDVDVYEPHARIPLVPSRSLAVEACAVAGRPAPLIDSDGSISTQVSGVGRVSIEIDLIASGRVAAGSKIRVPLLPRPMTTVEIQRDRDDLRLSVEPDVVLRGEGKRLRGVLPPSDALVLGWEKKLDEASPSAQRIEASIAHTVEVREGGIQGRAALDIVVEGQPVTELLIEIPPDLQGVRIQGPAVRATRQTGAEVTVLFAYPVTGNQSLDLRYDRGDAGVAEFAVPDLRIDAARRVVGSLVIVADPEVEVVNEGGVTGYLPADLSDLPEGQSIPSGTVVNVYTFYEQPLAASFRIRRHDRVPVLASAGERVRARTVVTTDGKAVTTYALRVTNNDRQFLRLQLPEGADTWSAFVDGRAVRPAMDDVGRLVVPIPKSRRDGANAAPYLVEMTWMWNVESPSGVYGGQVYELPRIDIVTTDIQWDVHVPERYRYFDFEGTLVPNASTAAPLTFDDDGDDTGRSDEAKQEERRPAVLRVEADKSWTQQREGKEGGQSGFLPVRIGVPATGRRLSFHRPLAGVSEPLRMSLRYYDRGYILAAEWLALLGLFLTLLAVFAHLLLAIRNLRFVRGPKWFAAGSAGLGVFLILQGLLPIAFPAWWTVVLLVMGAGALYGTGAFWAAIIGLSRSLWARFGESVMRHARSVMPATDEEEQADE